jgi:biotin carboxylase
VPGCVIADALPDAERYADEIGAPVVVKRRFGAAGDGVAIVDRRSDLPGVFDAMLRDGIGAVDSGKSQRVLVQAHVAGPIVYQNVAALGGRMRAGFAVEKLIANPHPKGPSTFVRYHHAPEVRSFSARLVEGFAMSGLFSIEYVIDARSGAAYLLEINRRVSPVSHTGGLVGVDLCAALHAALQGASSVSRADLDPNESHRIALFPQEWLRDPGSVNLRECRVDVPWDDPGLFAEMLQLRPR